MAKKLKLEDCQITVECLPEEAPIEGNVMASGDDAADKEAERKVREQLESGNEWAWCTVRVTLSWKGLSASESLACCSYSSENEFREGFYFIFMCTDALNQLQNKVDASCRKMTL